MTRWSIAAVLAVGLLFASPVPFAMANPERLVRQQTIMVNGTKTNEMSLSPAVRGAFAALDRRLARDGMRMSDYEKIEIGTTRNYIIVSAINLSKLREEPFDYVRAVTSIEYAFQAALRQNSFEILLLRSPEGMKFD